MTRAERDELRAFCKQMTHMAAVLERDDVSHGDILRVERAAVVFAWQARGVIPRLVDRIDELEAEVERLRGAR
jgi:hypothetical protein